MVSQWVTAILPIAIRELTAVEYIERNTVPMQTLTVTKHPGC